MSETYTPKPWRHPRYGGYSEQQCRVVGSSIYLGEDGKEYEVSMVSDDPIEIGWTDWKPCPVKLMEWVRVGTPDPSPPTFSEEIHWRMFP